MTSSDKNSSVPKGGAESEGAPAEESADYTDPREILAEVYRQISSLREQGASPGKITMHQDEFRLLKWYRDFLGETEQPGADYLGEYEIFGLPVYSGSERGSIVVE